MRIDLTFNSLAPDHVAIILRWWFSNPCYGLNICWEFPVKLIDLRHMSRNHSDDWSTLVPVMAWCRQATNHYLKQCWPRFILLYGISGSQWFKSLLDIPGYNGFLVQLLYLITVSNTEAICIFVPEVSAPQWPLNTKVSYVPHCHIQRRTLLTFKLVSDIPGYGAVHPNWQTKLS